MDVNGHSLERHTPWFIRAQFILHCQDKYQAMKSKEPSVDLGDQVLARHRSRQGNKTISKALSVAKTTIASIILKWKKLGTTLNLPRFGCLAKLGRHLGKKGFG